MMPTKPQYRMQKQMLQIGRKQLRFSGALTSANRRSEDVSILAVIIEELKFRYIQRQIIGTNFMEAANDTTLEDRPETLNRVRVDRANNVFMGAVTHESVLRIFAAQRVVGAQVVQYGDNRPYIKV